MLRELIQIILQDQSEKLTTNTIKSIFGVALSISLLLFLITKLDSFIINMEDFMVNLLPEIQFQRLNKEALPSDLKWDDPKILHHLIGDDVMVEAQGPLFISYDIYHFQREEQNTSVIKQILLLSSVITKPENKADVDAQSGGKYLINVEPYISSKYNISEILNGKDSNKIIISSRLQKKIFGDQEPIGKKLRIGTRLTNEERLVEVEVAGIYNNNSVYAAFVPDTIYKMVTNRRQPNNYVVRLKDKYQANIWRERLLDKYIKIRDMKCLQKADGDPECQESRENAKYLSVLVKNSWMDFSPSNLRYLKMTRIFMFFIFGMILLMTAVSIKLLFDTIIIEKRRQIAMLKVLGCSNKYVLLAFLYSGLFIGIVGVLSGIFIGLFLNWVTGSFESQYFYSIFQFQYRQIPPSINLILNISMMTIVLCSLSAVYPARSVTKIQPIEGLRRDG